MKQCSLTAMFTRPAAATIPTLTKKCKNDDEERKASSLDCEFIVSSHSQDEKVPMTMKSMTQVLDKSNVKSSRKRLKLAKSGEMPEKVKTVTHSDRPGDGNKKAKTVDLEKSEEFSKVHHKDETISSLVENVKPANKEASPPSNDNLRSKDSKEGMSYSDFLGLFQDPPKNVSDTNDEIKQERNEEIVNEDSNIKDCVKKSDIAKCKSIASYFQPARLKPSTQNKQKSSVVTVTAEVHSLSNSKKLISSECTQEVDQSSKLENLSNPFNNPRETLSPKGKNDAIANSINLDDGGGIIVLSSEIIKDESVVCNKVNRRKNQPDEKSKLKIQAKSANSPKDEKVLLPFVSDNVTNDLSVESSSQSSFQQSTLSFGKSGLSICKSVAHTVGDNEGIPTIKFKEEEEKTFEVKPQKAIDSCEESGQVSDFNSKIGNEGKDALADHVAKNNDDSKMADLAEEKDSVRNHRRCDSTVESKDSSEDQGQNETVSSPGPRRSSRIRTSLQVKKEAELVEIDSDDEVIEVKKTKSSKQLPSHPNIQTKKTPAKPKGKLAPIFMKGKSVEEEPKQIHVVPVEDPEKVCARKEFLMSGIPDELKRIMAATASANVEADYPPLPQTSHVQQISPGSLLQSALTKVAFKALEEREIFDVSWSKFRWSINEDNTDQIGQAISFPYVDESQSDVLLGEMESFDSTFPFRKTFNSCLKRKLQNNASHQSDDNHQSDDIVIIDDDSPPAMKSVPLEPPIVAKDLLWCDLYQPCRSTDIVGNTKTIKQLKDWLTEWHDLMQKEVLKAAKGKKAHKKSSKADSDWSDSDFTDSDEEDCRLCNTMLITGPHGIGKTSAVYGLAQEVGFKVFEVNASSLRSGKQLLSQLEEATQSHRVSSHKVPESAINGDTVQAGTCTIKSKDQKPSTAKKSKAPSSGVAFANLFGKSSNASTTNAKKEKGSDSKETKKPKAESSSKKSKKRIAEDLEAKDLKAGPESTKSGRALNITSLSLILFDEADIVFEEDKGFLATVQHFMASTKIPIILTSTDPSFHLQLAPRHHHITFKQPSSKSTVGFLYTVCLVNGIHVDWDSLSNIVKALKGDLRRCLLHLQFWCESGAGRDQIKESSSKGAFPPSHHSSLDQPAQNLFSIKKSGSLDMLKPLHKRPRMIIDDDSNSSEASVNLSDQEFVQDTASTGSKSKRASRLKRKRKEQSGRVAMSQIKEKPELKRPMIHYGCDASMVGENVNKASTKLLVRFLKSTDDSTSQLSSFPTLYARLRRFMDRDVIYSLALHCCSLPVTHLNPVILEFHAGAQDQGCSKKKKRKRILSDCFDSETSDNEREIDSASNKNGDPDNPDAATQNNEECERFEAKMPAKPASPYDSDREMKVDVESKDKDIGKLNSKKNSQEETKIEEESTDRLVSSVEVLSQFSKLYDTRSFVAFLEDSFSFGKLENSLRPGVEDQFSKKDGMDWRLEDALQDVCACVDSFSARSFTSGIDKCMQESCKSHQSLEEASSAPLSLSEEWELPIGSQLPDMWASLSLKPGISREEDPTVKNTKDCLGLWTHGSNAGISTDYLPMLREVCRFEEDRQAANKKRRFYHYLDYIGCSMKESTIASLASTYKVITSD